MTTPDFEQVEAALKEIETEARLRDMKIVSVIPLLGSWGLITYTVGISVFLQSD